MGEDKGELKANDGIVEENHTSYKVSDSDSGSDFDSIKAKSKAVQVLPCGTQGMQLFRETFNLCDYFH